MGVMTAQSFAQPFPTPVTGYGGYMPPGGFNAGHGASYSGSPYTGQTGASYHTPAAYSTQTYTPPQQIATFQPTSGQPSSMVVQQSPVSTSSVLQTSTLPTSGQSWGPKPMSGGPALTQDSASFSTGAPGRTESQSSLQSPSRKSSNSPITTDVFEPEGVESSVPVRGRPGGKPSAPLSPAEQTVKRLERPLIRFLDENPQVREKIDNINVDTLTDNLTNSMGSYRVSIHNAYNKFPRFIDNAIIKQLDPQMQDSARQFFDWIRKTPTAQELAETRANPTRRTSQITNKRARTTDSLASEKPVKSAKTGLWPFKRKSQAEPDLSAVNLDSLLSELQSRGM